MIKQLPDGTFRVTFVGPDGVRHKWIIDSQTEATFRRAIRRAAWHAKAKGFRVQEHKGNTNL